MTTELQACGPSDVPCSAVRTLLSFKKALLFSNEQATSLMGFAIKYTVLHSVGLIKEGMGRVQVGFAPDTESDR